ncbi:PAS domain S-box protein [Bacteroidota bacterium]
MKKSQNNLTDVEILRQKAEEQLKKQQSKKSSLFSENDLQKLVHELQVHQIELEMQNEELLLAKSAADKAAEKYTELYNFSPLGYFTLTKDHKIIAINFAGAEMLGRERSKLINSNFVFFVSDDTKGTFNSFLEDVFSSNIKQSCEIVLHNNDDLPQHIYLTGIINRGGECLINAIDITERKQVEDEFRKSEKKFHSLFSSMTEGVYLHEIIYNQKGEAIDYRIIETNPASEKHLNIKPEDAIGKLATELFETDEPPFLDIYAKVAKTGIYFQFDEYFPPLKKHFHISVYSTEKGKFATVFFDITDRKQKEIELIKAKEKAEENKKLLIETGRIGKVGGWEFNIDTLKSTWTEETYLIHEVDFNYDPNVEKGINFYTSTSKPIIDNAVGRAIKFGEPFNLELEIITAKNNLRNVHTIGKADLENRRVYGFFQDITERKQAEKKLREIKNEYKLLFNQIADPIVIFEQKTKKIIDCNTVMINKYGYSYEELLEMTPLELHPTEEDIERVKINIDNKEDFSPNEYLHMGKDGNIFYVETHSSEIIHKGHKAWITIIRDITERKQAEEKLAESEEKYKALYENSPLPYQSLNEDGSFNDINPAWLSNLGYEQDEVIGKFYKDFLHPDWKTHFETNFPALKKHGYAHNVNYKIRHKKGHYLDISFEGRIAYHPDGSFKQTYCVFQDITDKKLAEENLLKNQYYLSKAQEMGKIGTWELDIITNNLIWTDEAYKIFGVQIGTKMTYELFLNTVHPDDRVFVHKKWSTALKKEPYDIEHRLLINGNIRWVRQKAEFEFDTKGEAIKAIGFSQDITERKQAEEELQDSKDYLDKIINTVASPLFVKNEKYEFFLVNDALCSILNLRADELIGKTGFEHFPEEQFKVFIARDQEVLSSGIENINEEQLTDGTGEIRTIITRKTLYTDPAGNKFLVGVINDITERKQAEEALTKKMDEMQRFHNLTVDRELIMIDLKKEVNELLKKSGLDEKYTIVG